MLDFCLLILFFFPEWREDQNCPKPLWYSYDFEPYGPARLFPQIPGSSSYSFCHKVSIIPVNAVFSMAISENES